MDCYYPPIDKKRVFPYLSQGIIILNTNRCMEQLTHQEIDRYLGTYLEQYKLIKDIKYFQGEIEAELIPFIYPFTKEDSGYVNNTQINLYLSQLTYILLAKSISDKSFTLISNLISSADFDKRMHERQLFFTNINLKMKKVIYKKNMPIRGRIKISNTRKIAGRIFCDLEFDLHKGSCSGTLMGVY